LPSAHTKAGFETAPPKGKGGLENSASSIYAIIQPRCTSRLNPPSTMLAFLHLGLETAQGFLYSFICAAKIDAPFEL
jgi:hypothetical protein